MPSLYDFPNFFDLKGIFLFIFNLTDIFKSREGGTTRNWQSNEFDLIPFKNIFLTFFFHIMDSLCGNSNPHTLQVSVYQVRVV